jgi:XTP/dITP diphosphohydrolase
MAGMDPLLLASNNRGKLRELLEILGDLPTPLVTPRDLGLELEVDETGATYADNARLKAEAFARASGLVTVGDDSGLEVDALGGAPGVYSARYAGQGASDADRRRKLLEALRAVPPPRAARFRCAVVVAVPGPAEVRTDLFEGACEGEILHEERGTGGFGYDPLFYLPDLRQTMAELPPEVKNRRSHRARAALAALPFLRALLTQ